MKYNQKFLCLFLALALAMAVLLLLWWKSGGDWSSLSLLRR